MTIRNLILLGFAFAANIATTTLLIGADLQNRESWSTAGARDEILPQFSWEEQGGRDGEPAMVVRADQRAGLSGCWTATVAVKPGQYYRFSVQRQTFGLSLVRRAAPVRLLWLDDQGRPVLREEPTFSSYRPGERPRAEPEFPPDGPSQNGWTEVGGTYQAPPLATQLKLELHLRWGEPFSFVKWSGPRLEQCAAPEGRKVRLAAIHYQPRGGDTPQALSSGETHVTFTSSRTPSWRVAHITHETRSIGHNGHQRFSPLRGPHWPNVVALPRLSPGWQPSPAVRRRSTSRCSGGCRRRGPCDQQRQGVRLDLAGARLESQTRRT